MSEWVYFLHPRRENFAATMTDEESVVFTEHFAYLQGLLEEGVLILAGPTLGATNTGITVFRAANEVEAAHVMASDPVIRANVVEGELREFRLSLLEGRDH